MELWGRSAILKFGRYGTSYEVTIDTDKEFEGRKVIPQIEFDIKKSTADKNLATISIKNLAERSRNVATMTVADKGKMYIEFYAGYGGVNYLMFAGDVDSSSTHWNGREWSTDFSAIDGLVASKVKYNKSHAPKTDIKSIIADALSNIKDKVKDIIVDVKSEVTQNGVTLTGATSLVMEKLAAMLPNQNLQFTIQDGVAYVKPVTTPIDKNNIPKISKHSGLIGSPKKIKEGIVFTSLIQFGLSPGRAIELESVSDEFNGVYIIQKTSAKGSTRGRDWYIECEAKLTTDFVVVNTDGSSTRGSTTPRVTF